MTVYTIARIAPARRLDQGRSIVVSQGRKHGKD
jgi:hypothetical protein